MSHTPFRFLHASDLHLERPLAGVTDVPDELREIFLEAPYRAATRLIDAALAEQVDFVVLAGDVLDASLSGPRGPIFLCEQFQRLKHAGIAVYWAGGDIDAPARWPAELALPDNVRRFSIDRAEQIVHHRGGLPLCHVLGQSNRGRKFSPADFHATPGGLLNIAVVYGQANAALAGHHGIAYWALGGTHRSATRPTARQLAHYPGTPQGRRPQESGSHGATLVEVDGGGRWQTRRIYCDVVRWHTLEVRVDEHTPAEISSKNCCETGCENSSGRNPRTIC
jgi:DNA repair exonuclease SbcCD nuclease subunit